MNKYNFPTSYKTIRQPFVIPNGVKKLGIIGDLHIPYHSIPGLNIAFDMMLKHGIDGLLFNGDVIDFHHLSKFQHDPRKRNTKEELESTRSFLDISNFVFKGIPKYFKIGNHEERLEKYLMTKAVEIFDDMEFRLDVLLRFGEKGITLIDGKTKIMAGGLSIWHGHELNIKSAIVSPARTLFLRTYKSSLMGHLHASSQFNQKRSDDHVVGCWSVGHLGDCSPDYAVINNWTLGFAIVDINNEEFEVNNYKIINGKAFMT